MQHINRYTQLDKLNIPENAAPIVRSAINNRRIFSDLDDVSEAEPVTGGMKYGTRNKVRARYRPLEDIESSYDKDKAEKILKLLGHAADDTTAKSLKFQLDSWKKINNQNGLRMARGDHKGLMITAPTGFGKTACFMGGTIHKLVNGNYDRVIFVYPSRALLQDQLSRVLSIVNRVNNSPGYGSDISTGLWYGKQPYSVDDIFDDDKYDFVNTATGEPTVLNVTNHWNEDLSNRDFTIRRENSGYRVTNQESGDSFTHNEFVLNRKNIRDTRYAVGPEILLTTLESLENFGMKPHYSLVKDTDAFVFDEIHQYTGLRGSHASHIIRNIQSVQENEDQASLFIGSSATLEAAEDFGSRMFGFEDNDEDLATIRPPASDRIESKSDLEEPHVPEELREKGRPDRQNFYFMMTPEDGPGVASQYIQHAMMVGHSLSRPVSSVSSRQQMLSFIQSRSQIESLGIQVHNADTENQLWKYHRNIDDAGDWEVLADETDHNFHESTLNVQNIYSNSDTELSDLDSADVIQSTSFLEVGIDIGNLKYVTQYRPPGSISAFKQRAGRAGRKVGTDSHTFTLLSRYGGDSNFYYRANQFLDRDITTPFKSDNNVVEWIHSTLFAHYNALDSVRARTDWIESEEELLSQYFDDTLEWDRFSTFLLHTKSEFEELFDEQTSVDRGLINDSDDITALRGKLGSIKQSHDDELENIREYVSVDTESALLGDEGASEVTDAIRDQLATYLNAIQSFVDDSDDSLPDYLEEPFENAQGDILDSDTGTIDERIESLDQGRRKLETIRPNLESLEGFEDGAGLPSREEIGNIEDALEDLEQLRENGKIDRFGTERKRVYYMEQCLDQIKEYQESNQYRHGSLYFIKHLLRAAYYFYRCVNVGVDGRVGAELPDSEGRDQDDRVWYVPPNYFDDSGRYYWLKSEYSGHSPTQKSIDSILSQYAPFNEEYVDEDGTIQIFQPRVVREDGESKIDFSEELGEVHKGVKMPEQIELDTVQDLSGTEGRDVIAYSDYRFEVLENDDVGCPGGVSEKEYGKIYSKPTVETEVLERDLTSVNDLHDLAIGDVDAKAWIDSVDIEIQPREKRGDFYRKPQGAETITKNLETTDTKFGYVLETQGIKWDLSEYIEKIQPGGEFDILEDVQSFKGEIEPDKLEEIALNTAAHYLTLLVSDVSGVSAQLLLHSIDTSNNVVYVFEQTEGGQGVVDHFSQSLQHEPGAVLRSSYELVHNPQILSEYLFAEEEFVEEILATVTAEQLDESNEEGDLTPVKEVVGEFLVQNCDISFDASIERVTEEVVTILRDLTYVQQTNDDVSRAGVFKLKHALSEKRTSGESREDAFNNISEDAELSQTFDAVENETIRDLMWSPDIDDCRANLELPNSIANTAGTDKKSYLCLLALLDEITAEATTSELSEIMRRNAPWARTTDDGPLFLEL